MTLHSIGYLAKLHGVSTSTIRRWEASGLIEKAKWTLGGHRRTVLSSAAIEARAEDDGRHGKRRCSLGKMA